MNSTSSLVIVSFLALLSACDRTVTFQMPVNENLDLSIHRYDSTESFVETCEIAAGSSEMARVAEWLDRNRAGWEPSPVTYAPSVFIRGTDFSLNFLDEWAILNYDEGQFVRAIDPVVYVGLECASE